MLASLICFTHRTLSQYYNIFHLVRNRCTVILASTTDASFARDGLLLNIGKVSSNPEATNRYTSSTGSEEIAMQMHGWDGVGVVHRDVPEVDGCSLLLLNLRRRSS